MTRTAAREIAVRLCYGLTENPKDPEQLLGEVFDEEYFATLSAEDDVFADYPDDKQLEYIRQVIRGVCAHSAELDGYIDKYAVGWKFGRISRTAVAIMKTAMFEVLYRLSTACSAAFREMK
jgi:transcription antitermination protein NusB